MRYHARCYGTIIVGEGIFRMIVKDLKKLKGEDRKREIRLIRSLCAWQRILVSRIDRSVLRELENQIV